MKRFIVIAFALFMAFPAMAQVTPAATTNNSISITTGYTFQSILSAITGNTPRRSLTIENNNTSDNCLINVDGSVVAGNTSGSSITINSQTLSAWQVSILLLPGGSYTRYFPYIPSGPIVGTCAKATDAIYLDFQ